jgi:hypothetical protein
MTPPKWTSALSTIGGWLLAALVVIVVLVGMSKLLCRKPPQPVHVSPVKPGVDTLVLHDTTPGQVRVVVDRDSLIALEKKVQQLTDDKASFAIRETRLKQGIVKIDSVWRARMDSMAGMIAVQYRRGRIDVVQYQRPDYVRVSLPFRSWRNTFTLHAKTDGGLSIEERRLPFDLGAQLSLDGWTTFNATKFGGLASACLTIRTSEYLSGRAGVGWLAGSGPVIVAGVNLGVEF